MENNISITDLGYYVELIDLATSRGCLQGEDLYPAGTLRFKLINIVKSEGNISDNSEQITLQYLNTVLNLIELLARKNGLTGDDLLPVGTSIQKLANFINQAQQAMTQQSQQIQ